MDILDKTFVKGAVLTAAEMNAIVAKLNELIQNHITIGTTEGTAYDGAKGAALEEIVEALSAGSGMMYSVYIRNNLSSLAFAAQYGESCEIDFTFVSQYRDTVTDPYKATGELGICTVMIKNSTYSDFTTVKEIEIASGTPVKVDVAEFLTSGSNSVKISVKGENTDMTTASVTWTVTLTSLGISAPNFSWWNAFSSDITIPMVVNGNISKILHVTVTGDGYSQSYTQSLGTATYTDTPYNYSIPHPGTTGVYTITFYLSNSDNTIQTKSVTFNVMCITSSTEEVKLLCINNVADSLTNWQDNTLFDYAIYDGQSTTTNAEFTVTKDGTVVYSQEYSAVATNTKNTLTYPMEVETDDDSDFSVIVNSYSDDTELADAITLAVSNSLGYSATAGAVFYLNPKTRSNSQSNYQSVVNEVDNSEISVTWSNVNWGNDGWQTDDDGVRILKLLAGSKAVVNYQPLATEAARKGKTIEIDFKVDNVSDSSENIITIAESLLGFRLSPENVSLYSQNRQDSTTQDVPIDNGVRIRLTVVIMPDAYSNSGFNLVCVYINGKKNRQFAYESNDYFANSGYLTLGNDYATLALYGLRIYDSALTSEAVEKNYRNQLSTTTEKDAHAAENDVLDAEGTTIDYNATKLLYNVFMLDVVFPNLNNPSDVEGNLWVFFADKPERDFSWTFLQIQGQGTSSMRYLEWNIRMRGGRLKDSSGNKINSIATYADGTTDTNKVLMFEGVPKSGRLTAKKNWASSMQDHKAGSVAAFNDLFKQLGLTNEAIELDNDVRVAVYQEPFIGFSRTTNEEGEYVYTCMGEYTFGPDKGDDNCFGYDTDTFPNLISVEGSDNAPLGALFRVPWNRSKSYWTFNADEEAFQYNSTNCWDFDAGELNAGETEPLSTQRWVDAYNTVYLCSNRIKPYDGTLDELNADVTTYRSTGYEYWIAKSGDANLYNLYYYEAAEGKFIASDIGNGAINLKTQLSSYLTITDFSSLSNDSINTLFITARVAMFRATVPSHWDIADAIFHHNFTEFFAGTDQRAKNTYPYCFGLATSLWKWRLDDADTIGPIDNQGQDRKPYYCEMHDSYDNGQPIWNGETSVFWNLLELAYPNELAAGAKNMLSAMETLGGQTTGTSYDKVYAFYKKYFLEVKEYFPATIVNADAKRYENAKLAYIAGTYTNDTDPITQSHGDFYSAETAWFKKRIMYIMSKYSYGTFSADGTDTIVCRAAGDLITYEITPAVNMYPAIANGTSIVRGDRTSAGETCTMPIDLGGSSDQQNAIQGASWLLSIGDWHDKNVSGSMIVRGKRLKELILGSKTDTVVITITALTLSDCGSMQKVLVSNVSTLQGTLDLSGLENLREVYAEGTALTQIKLPDGGCLQTIEFPAGNKYISFQNFPLLSTEGLIMDECMTVITDVWIENCPLLAPMQIISDLIAAQADQGTSHALKHIRAVGFNETYYTADALDMLAELADGTYEGLSSEGLAGEDELPVLDGTITVHSKFYQDAVDALRATFAKLTLIMDGEAAIRFADSKVLRVLCEEGVYKDWVSSNNWGTLAVVDTDGDGMITESECEVVKSLANRNDNYSSVFAGNTTIETFNELQYFTSLACIQQNMFANCTNLREITLPVGPTEIKAYPVMGTAITHWIVPEGYTTFSTVSGYYGTTLEVVDYPSTTTTMNDTFMWNNDCNVFICRAVTPPTFASWGRGTVGAIYVPDESVDLYKAATTWSGKASIIYPLSEYVES